MIIDNLNIASYLEEGVEIYGYFKVILESFIFYVNIGYKIYHIFRRILIIIDVCIFIIKRIYKQ
ncbi:Hypothetical protein SFBmNL_00388 [Candidatus Arthromitus sp. SFB-mouse-NL]|nr:Hypothetical protein SFBmNL_00388 [Candidatus Arthromitus sp. SFB-mouse-NL]